MAKSENGTGPEVLRTRSGPSPASGGNPAKAGPEGTRKNLRSSRLAPAARRSAVGYVRVSTDRQAEQGAGLEVQRDALAAAAKARRLELVEVFADEGISGKEDLGARIGLAGALERVQSGEVAGVIVYRLDRLARDLMLQEQVLAEFWRAGGEVWSCSEAEAQYVQRDDPGDPSRKLIRQVLGAVAEYERAMISLRMAGGRAKKAARGGYAYGAPPFGWRAEAGELVEVPAEQVVVAEIRRLRAEGLSVRAIAKQLNAGGMRTRPGKLWQGEQVRRVLGRSVGAEG